MLKKSLLFLGVCAFASNVMAMEMTNPFYTSVKNAVTSVTSLDTGRSSLKIDEYKGTSYQTNAIEELSYGITDSFAVIGSVSNSWIKTKTKNFIVAGTDHDDKNIDFSLGGAYNILHKDAAKLQVNAKYGQSEARSHRNKGAYKYAKVGVKAGYDLGVFLPYASADIERPLFQSKYGMDKNIYQARIGAYKLFCPKWAIDAGLGYRHVEEVEGTDYTADAEVSYFINNNWTVGAYASYMLDGDWKVDAGHKADVADKRIGLRLRTAF